MSKRIYINCPKCGWEPDNSGRWMCTVCKTVWNTFDTRAKCPGCGKVFEETTCLKCKKISPHSDWYEEVEIPETKFSLKSIFSFGKTDEPPVTANDRKWIEQSLLLLPEMFDPVYFRSLRTLTPDKEYFDRDFDGTESDAEFILERLIALMNIDAWEIELMFYSNSPTKFSEGMTATPQEKLKGSWKSSSGKYIDKGLGHKEIWIELEELADPMSLIATMAHELSHYKLLGEYRMEETDEALTDLTAVAFGFGIFIGNSCFKFAQWTGTTHQGWRMKKRGYLPEQVIAYTMAWLAHYRDEDISWIHYLNKTMRKYFDQSNKFIERNKELIKWE